MLVDVSLERGVEWGLEFGFREADSDGDDKITAGAEAVVEDAATIGEMDLDRKSVV